MVANISSKRVPPELNVHYMFFFGTAQAMYWIGLSPAFI